MFWNEKCVCSNYNSKQLLFNDAFQKAWKRRTRTIIVKSSAGDRKPKLEEISLLTTSRSSVLYDLLESSDDLNNNVIRLRSLRTTLLLVHVYENEMKIYLLKILKPFLTTNNVTNDLNNGMVRLWFTSGTISLL